MNLRSWMTPTDTPRENEHVSRIWVCSGERMWRMDSYPCWRANNTNKIPSKPKKNVLISWQQRGFPTSVMYVLTVAISPPVNMPWSSRNTTSRQRPRKPAAGPLWYVGRHPWSTVPVPGTNLVCAKSMETAMDSIDAVMLTHRRVFSVTFWHALFQQEKTEHKLEFPKNHMSKASHSRAFQKWTGRLQPRGQRHHQSSLSTNDMAGGQASGSTSVCGLSLLMLQLLWLVYHILWFLLNSLRYLAIII